MNNVIVASNPAVLNEALIATGRPTATVEAEYGDVVVSGTEATLAHHGARASNDCPCLYDGPAVDPRTVFGLSHADLDAVGGVLALVGRRPGPASFWTLAAYVDVHGPHRMHEAGASAEDVDRLEAWWAWSEAHRFAVPRDGSVADATEWVRDAEACLVRIASLDPATMAEGASFAQRGQELERLSFLQSFSTSQGSVLLRSSDRFSNHLYFHAGQTAVAVVGHNAETGAITLSWESPEMASRHPAVELVQAVWGNLAGGHAGIAGSPRNERRTIAEARAFALFVANVLGGVPREIALFCHRYSIARAMSFDSYRDSLGGLRAEAPSLGLRMEYDGPAQDGETSWPTRDTGVRVCEGGLWRQIHPGHGQDGPEVWWREGDATGWGPVAPAGLIQACTVHVVARCDCGYGNGWSVVPWGSPEEQAATRRAILELLE